MKTININGVEYRMYKPEEVSMTIGYHPRTIRRFIQLGTINAVNSNKNGKQPVWWIPEQELNRLKKEMAGISADKQEAIKILKLKRTIETKMRKKPNK